MQNKNFDAIIAIGSIIKGETKHFDFVCNSVAMGIKEKFEQKLIDNGFGKIVTEINNCEKYYFAEEYHQQYLAKNVNGYCGLKGTGVSCV